MTNLIAETAVTSELTLDSRVGAVGLRVTFLTAVEAGTRLWRLGALGLAVTGRVSVEVTWRKFKVGSKDKELSMVQREVKEQQAEMEMFVSNEEKLKDLPILAAVEAATTLVATRFSVSISCNKTTIIVTVSSAAEIISNRLVEGAGTCTGVPGTTTTSSRSVPRHVESYFVEFDMCGSVEE